MLKGRESTSMPMVDKPDQLCSFRTAPVKIAAEISNMFMRRVGNKMYQVDILPPPFKNLLKQNRDNVLCLKNSSYGLMKLVWKMFPV